MNGWLTVRWWLGVEAERKEHDAGAADDREWGVWNSERGVERVQALSLFPDGVT